MGSGIRVSNGNFRKKNGEPANIRINVLRQKLESMLNIFVADNTGLPLLILRYYCFRNPRKKSRRICTKTEFNVKWLFKVTQGHMFGISASRRGTPYRYIIILAFSLNVPKL